MKSERFDFYEHQVWVHTGEGEPSIALDTVGDYRSSTIVSVNQAREIHVSFKDDLERGGEFKIYILPQMHAEWVVAVTNRTETMRLFLYLKSIGATIDEYQPLEDMKEYRLLAEEEA